MDSQSTTTYEVNIRRNEDGKFASNWHTYFTISHTELVQAKDPIAMVRQAVHDKVDEALDEAGPPGG